MLSTKCKKRDQYGGCTDVRFEATGFFRLEKADRWWLVTPEGNAFLSFGVNHIHGPGMLKRRENRDHWIKAFGLQDNADESDFLSHWKRKVREDTETFGFNTLGCHSPAMPFGPGFMPYVQTHRFVDICHYMTPTAKDFLDVFSMDFVRRCDEKARDIAGRLKGDPFLIGYSLTDCPIFTELDAAPRDANVYGKPRIGLPTWPRVLRNLGPDDPGKQAYVDCMRGIYSNDVRRFNRVYRTEFSSFASLCDATRWRVAADPENIAETRDNRVFLDRVVDRYYTVAVDSVRKYDSNHLVFGDKLNGNTDTPDSIVALAAKHMDLIFYQTYGYYEMQKAALDRWSAISRKPLFNGDSCYAVPTEMMPDPFGPHCADQKERALRSMEFARNAFSRRDFVGWNWCGWMDNWEIWQPYKQHSGLQDPYGRYYKPMVEAFSKFSAQIYDVATST